MSALSLLMPVFNEGETLEEILKRIGEVEFPVPFELIIVDDGSRDGAVDALDRGWAANAHAVHVLRTRRE